MMSEIELAKLIIIRTEEDSGLQFTSINDFIFYTGSVNFSVSYLFNWRKTREGPLFWEQVNCIYGHKIPLLLERLYTERNKYSKTFIDLNLYI